MEQLLSEIKEIRSRLDTLLTPRGTLPGENNLLSPGQVLDTLGVKHDDKAWKHIRKLLIQQYGMTRLPGVGYRIPRRNLEKFLSENYGI